MYVCSFAKYNLPALLQLLLLCTAVLLLLLFLLLLAAAAVVVIVFRIFSLFSDLPALLLLL